MSRGSSHASTRIGAGGPRDRHPSRALLWVSALVLACAAACGGDGDEKRLKVFAAASLRDAIAELADTYHARTGIEPILNFGSSGLLAVQIERGGRCDVFLSAGEAEMERLLGAGLVHVDSRVDLLSNQLVVIVAAGGRKLESGEELAGPWLERLSIANPNGVPAGRYAKDWLVGAGIWDAVSDRVLPGIDVRAALAAVEHGGADAGIVYRTDAAISDGVEIAYSIPLEEGPEIVYPAAIPTDRQRMDEARRFLDFLGEPGSTEVFERYGFMARQP
jgi:molybdate transport system substrate-binding protein